MKAKDYCNCGHARLHRKAGLEARLALLDGRKLSDLSDRERNAFNALRVLVYPRFEAYGLDIEQTNPNKRRQVK